MLSVFRLNTGKLFVMAAAFAGFAASAALFYYTGAWAEAWEWLLDNLWP